MQKDAFIVFFDGICPMCIGWVKFLLDRDGHDRLRFASLQSGWTQRFFKEQQQVHPGYESIVVWHQSRVLTGPDAIAEVASALPGIWSLGRHLLVLPKPLRDDGYRWVARNRYRWFGKREACWLPIASERRKFLDLDDPVYQGQAHGPAPDNPSDPDPGQGNR